MMAAADMESATISSTPVSVPNRRLPGMVFAEDRGQATRRAFGELPLLVAD
jgi:hypothetical protein